MRSRSIWFIKCIIGLAVAFIAVSNCFNVMSNSSTSPTSATDQSHIAAHNSNQNGSGLDPVAGAIRHREPLDSTGSSDLAGRAIKASAWSPFAPAITATKSHTPAGSALPGATLTYTVVIANTGTDATGVNFTDTIDPNTTLVPGSVKASPIAADDSYHTIGNVNISVPVAQGVTANDSNSGTGTLSVTKVNATVVPGGGSSTAATANGSVTMSSDGSFSYTPNVAFRGPSDSFTYELDNGSGSTDTATVTIAVSGLIWFVNTTAAPGGDGRLSSPFNCLVGPGCFDPTAADIANDNIFVYSGAYTGGLTLLSGQRLIGQGASQSLLTITGLSAPSGNNLLPSTGGANPTITSTTNGVNLGSGNQIWGMTFGSRTGAGISGTGFGTLTVRDTTINGTGQALNLSTGTLDAIFQSISSASSSSTGLTVNAAAGSMSVTGGTSVTSLTGVGVNLTNNTGTFTFSALDITNTTQKGLLATDNSNTITTTSGTISSTGAAAVEITRSTGTTPLVISLTSVSANGGANGIKLSNTSGGFTVVGDGTNTNNGSGGTLQNTTGHGIALTNAQNISFTAMSIQNTANSGIFGTSVTNFALSRCTINGVNTAHTSTDGNVAFNLNGGGSTETNVSGSVSITNNVLNNSYQDGISILNYAGNISTLTVTGNSFTSSASAASSLGSAINITANRGASASSITVGSISNNTITNFPSGAGIALVGGNTAPGPTVNVASTGSPLLIQDNNISGSGPGAAGLGTNGIQVTIGHQSNGFFTIGASGHPNTITNVKGNGIAASLFGTGTMKAAIAFNTINANNTVNSPGINTGADSATSNTNTPLLDLDIHDNNVSNTSGNGILSTVRNVDGTGIFHIQNNTVAKPITPSTSTYGIRVDSGNGGEATGATVCLTISGNVTAGSSNASNTIIVPGIGLRVQHTGVISTMQIQGLTPATSNDAQMEAYVGNTGQNPGTVNGTFGANGVNSISGGATYTAGTCIFTLSVPSEVVVSSRHATPDTQDILRAARGEAPKGDSVQTLKQEELNWMVQAAIERWRETGIPGEDLALMQTATFEVEDLPDGQIATAASSHFKIDETGAGFGWFIDITPDNDSEFDVPVSGKELQTTEFSPAHGKMDLLTVVIRELGHVYLDGKKRVAKNFAPLMEGSLLPAVRRMPVFRIPDRSTSRVGEQDTEHGKLASTAPLQPKKAFPSPVPAVFHQSANMMSGSYGRSASRMSYATNPLGAALDPHPFSGETVTLNIGTIPAGKSVTVTFQAVVNNPFPNGVCSVSNQGHVTGTNFSPVDTNIDVTPINKAVTISACPANITKNTDAGVCTAVATFTTPTGDGCPAPTVTCSPASGTAFGKGTTTVTCTATNGNPPDATCTFTVTVTDNQAPTITCPANVTQSIDPGQCSAAVTYANATATDNCSGVGTPVCTPASGSTFNKGTTTVTCTVNDASGNPATCSFTVTVNDTTPPTITCPANVTQSTDPNVCTAAVSYTNATATDNCPGVGAPACTPPSGSTFAKGTTTVNCSVSDASGNSASCSFTVTVNDTQAPSITCPANVTHGTDANQCSAVVTYANATATDNCPGVGTPVCTPLSGTTFAKGSTTVNCTVSDASGNPASCSFTVTINDMQAPTITCPGNVAQGTDAGQCTAVVNYANATASDNCPGVGTPVCSPASGSVFNKGTTTVTCNVSDASSNSASCSFTVTVNDLTPPTITCPANVTKSTDPNQCLAVVTYPNATASDSCSGVGTPACSPSSGSTFLKGVTTVTCTVSDSSGNSASCSFTVTVKDTQAPNLSPCPSNISVTSGGGCQVVNYTQPTATDNCGSVTVTCSPASGTCFPPGTTTVTCTASDTSPDSPDTSCSFTVTVVPCAITCPSNITVGNSPGQCGATVTYSPNTNGGCGTIVCSPSSGSFFPVGTTTVTCTTTAGPGCSFTVTVNDTEGPHITVTTQPIELWPPNHKYHTITMGDLVASATDNCSGNLINSVVIASVSSDELENSGGDGNTLNDIVIAANCKSVQLRSERDGGGNGRVYTIVFRVKDAAGNVGTASRTVTVPANQGGIPAVLGPGPGYTVNGTCP